VWSRAIPFLPPDVQVRATLHDGGSVRGRFAHGVAWRAIYRAASAADLKRGL